jgi:hypothetical protein
VSITPCDLQALSGTGERDEGGEVVVRGHGLALIFFARLILPRTTILNAPVKVMA